MSGMGPDDIPLFAMLKSRMGYLSQRQKVIAQNVANADTPGYRPSDLKPYSFQASLMNQASGAVYRGGPSAPTSGVQMMATSAARPSCCWSGLPPARCRPRAGTRNRFTAAGRSRACTPTHPPRSARCGTRASRA